MREIGLTLGVVESRVSQIHSAAIAAAAVRPEREVTRRGAGRAGNDSRDGTQASANEAADAELASNLRTSPKVHTSCR